MNNALRAWSFLILFSLTLIVLGQASLGREGLLISLSFVLGLNAYIYFFEDERILKHFKIRILEGQDPWQFRQQVDELSRFIRIPTPKCHLIDDPSPQAFVVGRSFKNSHIAVTQGLLEKFTNTEKKALIVYLLANVKNSNTLAFCVGSFMVSSLQAIAHLLDTGFRFLIFEKRNSDQLISQPFTRLMAPLSGTLLKLSIRPSFYFSSDQTASEILRSHKELNEKDLAMALWKLRSYSLTEPFSCPLSASHLFVLNPLTNIDWNSYFHAQPDASSRIRALIGHYPI